VSLDFTRVVVQVAGMVARLRDDLEGKQERLDYALRVIGDKSVDLEYLKKKIAVARTTWLVAGLVDGLDSACQAPSPPDDFTVVATDGSQIDVDRHRPTRCYLLNTGSVLLRYGAHPDAVLGSTPVLYAGDEDMVIALDKGRGREQPVEGALLGIKRGVEECRRLAEIAAGLPSESLALGLIDGSLILWGLEAYPEFVTGALLEGGFLACLEDMRKLNADRRLAVASYISFPRSTDVINALKVILCPQENLDTDKHCQDCEKRECEKVAGLRDSELFTNVLKHGERSALFASQSSIVGKRYGKHSVYFFYLKVDDEIARVEVPQWVSGDANLLNLAHSLVLDQCRRGQGYPVALSEAHEQAVVTAADRENFWQIVESSLMEEHLPGPISAKSRSKKTRWV